MPGNIKVTRFLGRNRETMPTGFAESDNMQAKAFGG
jgi:hypothetical protein